ncbi:PfkB family carbohydrate kinase [Paraglaciecola aquimarina]|uniref:PfkB family carbohydrate kinase n=1 Tax=Paraglaciecola aquimarina TaxID=1235557 RepID=A0ABU3SVE9_9ALTE|nr:PfkB family carbohydrate kinase [Paraglaciecola aquimarina]MDU0353907.1 PfkB family carbohydrate kinase [Paraglaciecola aquimarina]
MENIQVAVFGEALIDMISQESGVFTSLVGGSPFNVCRALSRQSINSWYMAPVSSDTLGKKIEAVILNEGVHAPFLGQSNKPTSIAIVTQSSRGLPAYTLYRDQVADFDISASEIIRHLPTNLGLFHTGSLVLVPEKREFLLTIFAYLKDKNIPISIDINMRKMTTVDLRSYHDTVLEVMQYADYLKVSDEDLETLGIKDNHEEYCQTLAKDKGMRLIALTKGELGACLISQDYSFVSPVIKPANFVDTVGAGDTFFASLISYVLRNKLQTENLTVSTHSLFESALNYAQVAASINISKQGCQPPNIDEISVFAKSQDIPI